jgi:hypothetical protein
MAKRYLNNLLIEGDISIGGAFIFDEENSVLSSASVMNYSELKQLVPEGYLLARLGDKVIRIPYFSASP